MCRTVAIRPFAAGLAPLMISMLTSLSNKIRFASQILFQDKAEPKPAGTHVDRYQRRYLAHRDKTAAFVLGRRVALAKSTIDSMSREFATTFLLAGATLNDRFPTAGIGHYYRSARTPATLRFPQGSHPNLQSKRRPHVTGDP